MDQVAPHNIEAERALIGAILLGAKAGFDHLKQNDFFSARHRLIFPKVQALREAGREVDFITLVEELTKSGELENVGGESYIVGLTDGVPAVSDISEYARIVKEKALLRKIINASVAISARVYEGIDDPDTLLDAAIENFTELAADAAGSHDEGVSFRAAALDLLESLEKQTGPRICADVETLDHLTGGFRPGELILVTGETGMGKSLFAQQIRRRACRDNYHTLLCSAEMDAKQILARVLASESGVLHWKLRAPEKITHDEFAALTQAAAHECDKCRVLDGELSLSRIRNVARRMKAKAGLELAILDYDELIDAPGDDELEQQQHLVRGAKSLAVSLPCVVILISQLRKLVQGEDRKRPTLQRLYGSSAKAKHPSLVVYVDREYVRELRGDETAARICVLKNRHGQLGAMDACFNIHALRFEDAPKPKDETDPGQRERLPYRNGV